MIRAFLETYNKEYLDDFVYISKYPLQTRGYKIIKTSKIENYEINFNDVCVGSVQFYDRFFKSINIKVPKYIGYPDSIKKFLNRKIQTLPLGDLVGGLFDFPIFIKPYEEVKLFTGTVIDSKIDFELFLKFNKLENVPQKLIYVSEVVDIVSEYRIFVHKNPDGFIIKNKIAGVKHYFDSPFVAPDCEKINEMIDSYTDSPVCYTLDVGINSFGSTFLIEINDMWATGSYGLNGTIYTKLLLDRLAEIKKQSKDENYVIGKM